MSDTRINLRRLAEDNPAAFVSLTLARRRRRHGAATMDLGRGGGMKALLEQSVGERDSCVNLIEGVTAAAFEAKRDLSDQDHDTITRARERIEFLDKQIERISFDTSISDRARAALASNGVAGQAIPLAYRSAGEAVHDLLHMSNADARTRLETEMSRAAQHMGADAANTVAVAGGLGALVIKPIVGPIIDPTPSGRPFLTALGVMPLESPLGFSRPRIVDPVTTPGHANYGDAPDVQGAGTANVGKEKTELVSRAFDIKLDSIDSDTVGEYLNISQKLLSLPIQALTIIMNQLTKRRAIKTENLAVAEILTSASRVDLALDIVLDADTSEAGAIYDALWEAAALVYTKTGELPTWLAIGPAAWQRLGRLRDRADRPLFPAIGAAVNAMGTMSATGASPMVNVGPIGLNVIVTPGITGPEMVVGNAAGLEVYEYAYPVLEAIEPSVLGRQIAVASELAFYRPATDEPGGAGNAEGNGAVVIAPPVGP